MSLISFFKLVEIQTKVASITPFLLGTVYSLYRYKSFNSKNFILMLVSLLAIDMATTAINNYFDFKKANKTHGYNYESHNAIVSHNIKESTVITTILMLLIVAVLSGMILFLNTNIVILILGAMSFAIGVLYSFGPIPISRTPLGELFSGLFMGSVITFIAVYIHVYDQGIVLLAYKNGMLNLGFNIIEALYIFLVSIPAICGIANIMLANNICDIEDDMENRRYTLPIYIGKNNSLILFKTLYYISYIDLIVLLIFRAIPLVTIVILLTLIPVNKNIKMFLKKQTKKDTFSLSVKNFVLINAALIIAIAVGTAIRYLR